MEANPAMFAGIIGGWEILLIVAVVGILFFAKRSSEISKGLHRGFSEFVKALKEVLDRPEQSAKDAGRSIGGIFGKRAAQALTPDNQVAELYEPAVFANPRRHRTHKARLLLLRVKQLFRRILSVARHALRSLLSGRRSD